MFQFGVRKKVLFSINISIRFNALANAGMPVALTQYERLAWGSPQLAGCRRYSLAVAPYTKERCRLAIRNGISADFVRSTNDFVR
jgi:hypothetical protein